MAAASALAAAAHGVADGAPQSDDSKRTSFGKVDAALAAFHEKYPGIDTTARMATLNAFLKREFPSWHFVGFYTSSRTGEMLQIGPYQGDVLATALIAFGKGQCGACAAEKKTQIQVDVSTCANYIACDDVTRSEIVVPVFSTRYHDGRVSREAELVAVLDIDSPVYGNFNDVDKEELEALVRKYVSM